MIYNGLWGSLSAQIFTCIVTGIFIFSVAVFCLMPSKRQWIVGKAPGLLTTIGLFGTFWGVAEGLGSFNASDIDSSVITLLSGMKLAFWTSILGMFYAFLINILQYVVGIVALDANKENIGAGDIHEAIFNIGVLLERLVDSFTGNSDDALPAQVKQIKLNLAQAFSGNREAALLEKLVEIIGGGGNEPLPSQIAQLKTALTNAISGNKDPSLYLQFRRLRGEATQASQNLLEKFDVLQAAFNSFASKMAENNSKALTDALTEVMRDFNTKINEQFGDNFKQLNLAVGALLKWQENYRSQIEALVSHFQDVQSGIEAARKGIADIKNNVGSIPATLTQLQATVTMLDKAIRDSTEVIGGFVELRNKAGDVFPTIQKGITDLTEQMQTSITQSTAAIDRTTKAMELSTKTQSESITKLGERVTEITINSEAVLKQGIDDVQATFKKAVEEMDQAMKKSFQMLDAQTQESLERIIGLMGSRLASISEKLVSDHQVLVSKISNLANVATAADRQQRSGRP